MQVTITLPSDNLPLDVQILPLFALDHIGPHDPGDFTYTVKTLLGKVLEQPYPFEERLKNPPPEPVKDEDDTWKLTEWERWQAALLHNRRRWEAAEERAVNVAHEVLERCLKPEDHSRIITPADYDAVYRVAVPEEVREEHVAQTLRGFFRSEIRGDGTIGRATPLQRGRTGRLDRPSDLPGMGNAVTDRTQDDDSRIFGYSGDGTVAAGTGRESEQMDGAANVAETGKGANTIGLIAGLIFYEQRQCRALGIQSSRSLRQWLFYYGRLRQLEARYMQAAMLNEIIRAGQQTMKLIAGKVENSTPEQRRALLVQARDLQAKIRRANNQLRKLDNAGII